MKKYLTRDQIEEYLCRVIVVLGFMVAIKIIIDLITK